MKYEKRNGLEIYKTDKYLPLNYLKANKRSKFKTDIFKSIRDKKINKQIREGKQATLDQYYNNNLNNILKSNIPSINGIKTTQTVFKQGGELYMEQNPELDVDVSNYPENTTVKANVISYRTGTVRELWDVDESDEKDLNGIEFEDKRIQIDLEVEYDGNTFEITEDYPFYENPSSNTKFGSYVQRWGSPEVDQTVSINFAEDGEFNVVGVSK